MSEIKVPLAISVAGHVVCVALLVAFLSDRTPAVPEPVTQGGIEVMFEPAPPRVATAPITKPPPEPEDACSRRRSRRRLGGGRQQNPAT